MNRRSSITGRVLIVESDGPLGSLYTDIIRTHCPGLRTDHCRADQVSLIEDNAGGADLAILSCAPGAAPFDTLRVLLTIRPCLTTLVLAPADRPDLADAAVGAGGSDVLLKAPGYLDQLAVTVRKNVILGRTRMAERSRARTLANTFSLANREIAELRGELAAATPRTIAGEHHDLPTSANAIHVRSISREPVLRAA